MTVLAIDLAKYGAGPAVVFFFNNQTKVDMFSSSLAINDFQNFIYQTAKFKFVNIWINV